MKREFTDDMAEISGFGGGYEAACRAMVLAGVAWLDEHPDAEPAFRGYKGVFGLVIENNADAKALTAAITAACDDCSGAMHHAAVNHCLFVKRHGWDKYVEELCKQKEEAGKPREAP